MLWITAHGKQDKMIKPSVLQPWIMLTEEGKPDVCEKTLMLDQPRNGGHRSDRAKQGPKTASCIRCWLTAIKDSIGLVNKS